MNEEQISPGMYLQKLVDQKTREVAARHNDAGLVSMWSEAVKEVLTRFPNLSSDEKSALRGSVEWQVQSLCERTRRDPHTFTGALQEVARILGR